MSKTFKLLGVLAIGAALSACGQTPAERGATGALTGAALAAVTGEDVVTGALIVGAGAALVPCFGPQPAAGCF